MDIETVRLARVGAPGKAPQRPTFLTARSASRSLARVKTRHATIGLPLFLLAPLLAALSAGCGGGNPPADAPADGAPADADTPSDPAAADAPPADAPTAAAGGDAAPAGSAAPAPSGSAPGGGAPGPAPKASAMDLGGTLSPAQVAKFVEDHQSFFDPCIQIAEKASKVYKVSITTRVWVGPRGVVNKTEVVKTTSKDKSFGTCVTGAFEKIPFGKPREGATATLTFPMTFSGEVQ